jgi:hypothetical protein
MIYLYHMDFLITERQLKHIVENRDKDNLSADIKYLSSFGKDVFEKVKQKYGIDAKLLITWGASVGGFVAPLDNYIRTNNFELTDDQIFLILFGCISTLILDNQKYIKQSVEIIEKEGLIEVFNKVKDKGIDLRNYFIGFLSSLNISVSNIVSLVRYSFLIPIIPDLMSYFNDMQDLDITAKLITKRIFASGVITVSSEILFQIIKRSLNKIRK